MGEHRLDQAAGVEPDAQDSAVEQSPQDDATPAGKPNYPAGYINEGPLPEGFPPPSEVGQVVEKSYPLCRTYSAEGNNAFMRCFAYLVKQKHEMTAPVIMDYKHNALTETMRSRTPTLHGCRSNAFRLGQAVARQTKDKKVPLLSRICPKCEC